MALCVCFVGVGGGAHHSHQFHLIWQLTTHCSQQILWGLIMMDPLCHSDEINWNEYMFT